MLRTSGRGGPAAIYPGGRSPQANHSRSRFYSRKSFKESDPAPVRAPCSDAVSAPGQSAAKTSTAGTRKRRLSFKTSRLMASIAAFNESSTVAWSFGRAHDLRSAPTLPRTSFNRRTTSQSRKTLHSAKSSNLSAPTTTLWTGSSPPVTRSKTRATTSGRRNSVLLTLATHADSSRA